MKARLISAWKHFLGNFAHKEKEHEKKTEFRIRAAYIGISAVLLIEMWMLYYNSGSTTGLNPKADQYRQAAIAEADLNTIAARDIFDRKGVKIVSNEEPGEDSVYADDYAYLQILGYTGPTKLVTGLEVSDTQRDYRFMQYYRDNLYKTTDVDGTKGQSFTLTLDHDLQVKVKELLLNEMELEDSGSAVVLNAKTGEILAMVSFPTFNANDLDTTIHTLDTSEKEEELRYPISYKGQRVPGSIFKIVTAVSLLDNGLENFTAQDKSFIVDGSRIVNVYPDPGDTIGYRDALIRSSNVFFARAALELGSDKLTETAKKFKVGEYLELDFGSVNSNWDLDDAAPANLAHTGFGQGKTLFSTMTAAMMMQAIANDGTMMQPYLVRQIIDADGKVLQEGTEKVLSEVTSQNTADKITEALVATVDDEAPDIEGGSDVYETYPIAVKTGTGENGDEEETDNAWFVSFAPADNPRYVVVVNQIKTHKWGYQMMDTAAEIYRYLFEEYDEND